MPAYRIPGLATTNEGTLIAVYDIRHQGWRDLPGNIDVGMSRSTDKGQTWEPMKMIMDTLMLGAGLWLITTLGIFVFLATLRTPGFKPFYLCHHFPILPGE